MPRQEQQVNGPKEASMARRRYQKGSLVPTRGLPTNGRWVARWRDDVLQADGTVTRPYSWEILGTIQDYPTRRLALRALESRLSTINSPTYRARPTVMFAEFAKRWEATVLTQHNPSTQSSTRSQLRKWLVPQLGSFALKDMDGQAVQAFVCDCHCNAKTVRNLVATLRMMWNSAKSWGYVAHDPFQGLVLPKVTKREQPHFGIEAAKAIIARAKPPYDVVFETIFETGVRRGEVCALNVGDVHLDLTVLVVRRSRWGKHIGGNKANRARVCALSPQLAEKLRALVAGRNPEGPLFTTTRGKRLHPDNFVKRVLKPILVQLKLEGGAHGFRHGNATLLDRIGAPMAVRQSRLGHVDAETTMGYTQLVTADERALAVEFGRILLVNERNEQKEGPAPKTLTLMIQ
jgi:integrase